MATIDLGKIAFVNKGTYNNSTTYEKNDLVQFTDGGLLSTYLYIDSTAQSGQAPSSSGTAGSRWVYFAKGGAAGTDLTTTLTTQGDLVYRDGSGLQRLGAGVSGQLLQTGGTGANVSWTDAPSGKIKQIVTATDGANQSHTGDQTYRATTLTANITTTGASNKIMVIYNTNLQVTGSWGRTTVYRDSTNISPNTDIVSSEGSNIHLAQTGIGFDTPGSVGTFTYTVYYRGNTGQTTYYNPGGTSNEIVIIEHE